MFTQANNTYICINNMITDLAKYVFSDSSGSSEQFLMGEHLINVLTLCFQSANFSHMFSKETSALQESN